MNSERSLSGYKLRPSDASNRTAPSSLDSDESAWQRMDIESAHPPKTPTLLGRCKQHVVHHKTVILVSLLVFAILCGAGVSLAVAFRETAELQLSEAALDLALDTGRYFRDELNKATLPLFSLATVAVELQEFHDIHSVDALPMKSPSHRNLTNSICEDPNITARFSEVAGTIKRNARMPGVLVLLELVPQAVVCLVHPKNNTEDFEPPVYFDPQGSLGLDLLSEPFRWHGETTLKNGDSKVTIAGPMKLRSCKGCHPAVEQAFMARLPIRIPGYHMDVPSAVPGEEPTRYPYWGFAVTKLNWKALVEKSGMYENFERKDRHAFQLTRTDSKFNATTGLYTKKVVVLGESPSYTSSLGAGYSAVHTQLNTTDSDWEMTVTYYSRSDWEPWVFTLIFFLSFGVACMVYVILLQKHQHTEWVGRAMAQEAMVQTERGMTSYFAHELRNPLGAIDSALQAMPDEGMPEAAEELLAGMKLCSSFMSGVMNNLLDVRQMEEGKVTLHRMPIQLETIAEELHRMFLPSVHPSVQFRFKSNIKDNEPKWVTGDLHRIQQVFTNVVSNALKYTKEGSVTITIGWVEADAALTNESASTLESSSKTPSATRAVRFECTDTGPGIPKHVQAQLFQRFARRGGAPGTGLGLAISKRLVDMMNGSIRFESDPTVERGATCIVDLPLPPCTRQENDGKSDDGSKIDKPRTSLRRGKKAAAKPVKVGPIEEEMTILIVDDIKMNRMMLKRRFQKAVATNSKISEACTGEEALELCKRDSFDVIIMDQYMEGAGGVMLGTDTIIALKRMKVGSLLIGCSGNDMAQEFKDAGADYCWLKPLPSNEEIIKQLRTSLDRHPRRASDAVHEVSSSNITTTASPTPDGTPTILEPPVSSSLFAIPPLPPLPASGASASTESGPSEYKTNLFGGQATLPPSSASPQTSVLAPDGPTTTPMNLFGVPTAPLPPTSNSTAGVTNENDLWC